MACHRPSARGTESTSRANPRAFVLDVDAVRFASPSQRRSQMHLAGSPLGGFNASNTPWSLIDLVIMLMPRAKLQWRHLPCVSATKHQAIYRLTEMNEPRRPYCGVDWKRRNPAHGSAHEGSVLASCWAHNPHSPPSPNRLLMLDNTPPLPPVGAWRPHTPELPQARLYRSRGKPGAARFLPYQNQPHEHTSTRRPKGNDDRCLCDRSMRRSNLAFRRTAARIATGCRCTRSITFPPWSGRPRGDRHLDPAFTTAILAPSMGSRAAYIEARTQRG